MVKLRIVLPEVWVSGLAQRLSLTLHEGARRCSVEVGWSQCA